MDLGEQRDNRIEEDNRADTSREGKNRRDTLTNAVLVIAARLRMLLTLKSRVRAAARDGGR